MENYYYNDSIFNKSMNKQNNDKRSYIPADTKIYTLKKGIVFGAIGGFVASICFAGFILCMSVLFKYPEGAFFDALGILINYHNNDIVSIGLSALVIIFIHGIIIGIILGIIMSKMVMFRPTDGKKGALFGLVTGFISFLVLYFPMVYISSTYQNLLSKLLSIMTNSTYLFTRGTEQMNSSIILNHMPTSNILLWGLLTYLIYGLIVGEIIALSYSIYNFDCNEIKETK